MSDFKIDYKIYYGPNIHTKNKAVIVNYNPDFINDLDINSNDTFAQFIDRFQTLFDNKALLQNVKSIENFIAELFDIALNHKVQTCLSYELVKSQNNHQIIIQPINEFITVKAINLVFQIIHYLKDENRPPLEQYARKLLKSFNELFEVTPGIAISDMQNAALESGIPQYIIDYHNLFILYGQGKNGHIFDHGSSDEDSGFGHKIQKNKNLTSQMLKSIGYPSSEQIIVNDDKQCLMAAENMGFPVVIKPQNLGRGEGVTANINSVKKLEAAFNKLRQFTNGQFIIEKHIYGDDHRITVTNGQITGVSKKVIPNITGDSKHTIQELIDIENGRREKATNQAHVKPLKIDQDMLNIINFEGYDLNSVLPENKTIQLRDTANATNGADLVVLDDNFPHPDNIAMFIDIAKTFRLGSIGIDFITPDISKSWKEVGTIIEVNSFPFMPKRLALNLMKNQFSNKNNGRIDTVLVVSSDDNFVQGQFEALKPNYNYTVITSTIMTHINGTERSPKSDNLYDRCKMGLINPNCDFLMVHMTADEIIEHGLPIDKFGQIIIDEKTTIQKAENSALLKKKTGYSSIKDWLDHVSE